MAFVFLIAQTIRRSLRIPQIAEYWNGVWRCMDWLRHCLCFRYAFWHGEPLRRQCTLWRLDRNNASPGSGIRFRLITEYALQTLLERLRAIGPPIFLYVQTRFS